MDSFVTAFRHFYPTKPHCWNQNAFFLFFFKKTRFTTWITQCHLQCTMYDRHYALKCTKRYFIVVLVTVNYLENWPVKPVKPVLLSRNMYYSAVRLHFKNGSNVNTDTFACKSVIHLCMYLCWQLFSSQSCCDNTVSTISHVTFSLAGLSNTWTKLILCWVWFQLPVFTLCLLVTTYRWGQNKDDSPGCLLAD